MSKIKAPNEKSNGFIYTLIAVLVIVAGVIGYIVVSGNKAAEPTVHDVASLKVVAEGDTITLSSENTKSDAKEADLYEDYSCPHCGDLAKETDAGMLKQIEDGNLIVHIHSLNFLDQGEYGNSSMAGTAAETVALSGDAQAYWNYRANLFENQKKIYSVWKMQDFADSAKNLGASDDTVKAIEDEKYKDEYLKEAAANQDKLRGVLGKVSSPQVIYNGASVNIANEAGTGFADWAADIVAGKYDK